MAGGLFGLENLEGGDDSPWGFDPLTLRCVGGRQVMRLVVAQVAEWLMRVQVPSDTFD